MMTCADPQPTSSQRTEAPWDGSLLLRYACANDSVSLAWGYSLAAGQALQEVQWLYEGRSFEVVAVMTHGHFQPLPAFAHRVHHATGPSVPSRRDYCFFSSSLHRPMWVLCGSYVGPMGPPRAARHRSVRPTDLKINGSRIAIILSLKALITIGTLISSFTYRCPRLKPSGRYMLKFNGTVIKQSRKRGISCACTRP